MSLYLGGAPAFVAGGGATTRSAEATFAGRVAAAVLWPRAALSPAEVAVLFQMTRPAAGVASDWLTTEPAVPCLAASAAPDFARGYGGWAEAATWVVGETVRRHAQTSPQSRPQSRHDLATISPIELPP